MASTPQPSKRQKVATACNPCRSRKVKCDGHEPVCSRCHDRIGGAAKCTWNVGPISQNHLDHIRSLEDKIRQLEGQDPSRPVDDSPADHIIFPSETEVTSTPAHLQASNPGQEVYYQESGQTHADHSPGEGLVSAIIGATSSGHDGEDFYGSASAGTFLQKVKRLVRQDLSIAGRPVLHSSRSIYDHPSSSSSSGLAEELRQPPLEYVLPSRRTADSLLATYFDGYIHPLYPWLDKDQIFLNYEKLWSGGEATFMDERSFLCILNAIFAVSTQLSGSLVADARCKAARKFSQRSQALLNVFDPPSLQSVQSYLLLGLYFQSTNDPHACWVYVGLGIRTAQSLGLHLPHTSQRTMEPHGREMLRKIWHGCVLMDRVLSMTYGRPCMIGPYTATAVPLPLSTVSKNPPHSTNQHTDSFCPRTLVDDFYVSALRLYEILHDVLFNFYRTDDTAQTIEDVYDKCFGNSSVSVFQIDRRLSRWEQSLPEHLSNIDHGPVPYNQSVDHRQAVVLRQRLLHIRLLLLRPVLSHFISSDSYRDPQLPRQYSPSESRSLAHRSFLQCAVVCALVAQETIDIVHQHKSPEIGEVGQLDAWWYNVLFLYTSATVLIAARLSPAILTEVSEESLLSSWGTALSILEEYATFNTSIQFLIATLRLLFDAIPQQYSRFKKRTKPADIHVAPEPSHPATTETDPSVAGGAVSANNFPLLSSEDNATSSLWPHDLVLGEIFADLDFYFDPNDLSWLTTMPVNS